MGCQGGQITLRLALAGFAAFFFHSSFCSGSILLSSDVRAPIGFPPFHFRSRPRSILIFRMPGFTRIRTRNAWRPLASKPTNERKLPTTANLPTAYFLAISGGGDDGAFGAGLLAGWSARGDRPVFGLVTGVSTGALSAPFAFLGDGVRRKAQAGLHRHECWRHFQ